MEKSKVSLHNHLGRNGRNPGFDKTVDVIYQGLGPGAVFGIANCNDFRFEHFISQPNQRYHRNILGYNTKHPAAVYVPEKQMLIIRGQEVFSNNGHFLVFGYEKNIEKTHLDDALREAVDNNAIIGTDHRYYRSGLGKFLEENREYEGYFDFDEVYNGTSEVAQWGIGPRKSNERAIENYQKNLQGKTFENPLTGKKHLIGAAAFGDTHQLKRVSGNLTGKSYTLLDLKFMKEDISDPEWIDKLRYSLHYSNLDNCVMKPNRWDALCHVLNLTVVNRVEKILGVQFQKKPDALP